MIRFTILFSACWLLVLRTSAQELAPLNYLSPNDGLRLEVSPTYPPDPENPPAIIETNYVLKWWSHSGRCYYIEGRDDLIEGEWRLLMNSTIGYFSGDYVASVSGSFDSQKYFFRLRYTEGRRIANSELGVIDTDHDGVFDNSEMSYVKTHPLDTNDTDDDGLPDDWERYHFYWHTPPENQDGDPTNNIDPLYLSAATVPDPLNNPNGTVYHIFKSDWAKGVHLEYGGQFFWYDRAVGPDPHTYLYRGDQDGALRVTYSDADHTRVQSLIIYPATPLDLLLANHTIQLSAEPKAIYSWVEDADPTRSGFSFAASPGYSLIRDPESNLITGLGALDGRPAPLDLLRSIDTMEHAAGAPRPRGATRPLPFKRALLDGTTPRRIPAPLAITSLPVTQIGRDRFPVIIREASHQLPHFFQDFQENYVPEPGPRMVEQAAASEDIINPVMRTLDTDGLPHALADPSLYPSSGGGSSRRMLRSPLTFARWYRDNSARGYVMQGIHDAYAPNGFSPPGYFTKYHYGFYSGADGFYPHRDEVRDISKFTTEMHCRLEYTPDTQLFIETNDDCWVFVNGKLVSELDLGGIPDVAAPPGSYQQTVSFAAIREQLGLIGESGTCHLAVFHADRFTAYPAYPISLPYAQLRILSTTALRPIYCYQVVAESATQQPLIYSFAMDEVTQTPIAPDGMLIEPNTGKIMWDIYSGTSIPAGAYPVVVKVSDPLGNTDTQSFDIIVNN